MSVQAIVLPGGVWDEAIHGCWTLLQVSPEFALSCNLTHPSTLLHEVARCAQSQESKEVLNMTVEQNPETLWEILTSIDRSEHQAPSC